MAQADWNDNTRRDGIRVEKNTTIEGWCIISNDGHVKTHICPCCDRPMLAAHNAKLVADAIYPITTVTHVRRQRDGR